MSCGVLIRDYKAPIYFTHLQLWGSSEGSSVSYKASRRAASLWRSSRYCGVSVPPAGTSPSRKKCCPPQTSTPDTRGDTHTQPGQQGRSAGSPPPQAGEDLDTEVEQDMQNNRGQKKERTLLYSQANTKKLLEAGLQLTS